MLTMIDKFIGLPIMSLQTGSRLAETTGVIIDPRQLTVAAMYVDGQTLTEKPSVLHPVDIREVSDIGLIIDDESKLMPLDGLVRLQETIDFDFKLEGLRVVDEDGKKHGKVSDYAIDPLSFTIQQIYTSQSLFRSFSSVGKIIHRSQVVSVNNDELVIKSTKTKVEAAEQAPSLSQNFVNPFRQTEQPEG